MSKRLDALWTKDADLRKAYTEESTPVKENLQQFAEAEKKKLKLEEDHPALVAVGVSLAKSGGSPTYSPTVDPAALASAESARILLLDAKIRYLHSELDAINAEQVAIAAVEPELIDLQRTKQLQETNYHYFAVSQQQAQIDEALGAGKSHEHQQGGGTDAAGAGLVEGQQNLRDPRGVGDRRRVGAGVSDRIGAGSFRETTQRDRSEDGVAAVPVGAGHQPKRPSPPGPRGAGGRLQLTGPPGKLRQGTVASRRRGAPAGHRALGSELRPPSVL